MATQPASEGAGESTDHDKVVAAREALHILFHTKCMAVHDAGNLTLFLQTLPWLCMDSAQIKETVAEAKVGSVLARILEHHVNSYEVVESLFLVISNKDSEVLFDNVLCSDAFVLMCFEAQVRWKRHGILTFSIALAVTRLYRFPAYRESFQNRSEGITYMMKIMRDSSEGVVLQTCCAFFVDACDVCQSLAVVIARAGGVRRALSFLKKSDNTHDMTGLCLSLLRMLLTHSTPNDYKFTTLKLHRVLSEALHDILKMYKDASPERYSPEQVREMNMSVGISMVVLTDICRASLSGFDTVPCQKLLLDIMAKDPDMEASTQNLFLFYLNDASGIKQNNMKSVIDSIVHSMTNARTDTNTATCMSWLCKTTADMNGMLKIKDSVLQHASMSVLLRALKACRKHQDTVAFIKSLAIAVCIDTPIDVLDKFMDSETIIELAGCRMSADKSVDYLTNTYACMTVVVFEALQRCGRLDAAQGISALLHARTFVEEGCATDEMIVEFLIVMLDI